MALFKTKRDLTFQKGIIMEYLQKYVNTPIEYYKLSPGHTKSNIYGESLNKQYYEPMLIYSIVNIENNYQYEKTIDRKRTGYVSVLRDNLQYDFELIPEMGDVIKWEGSYYEVTQVSDELRQANKGAFWYKGDTHGQLWVFRLDVVQNNNVMKDMDSFITLTNLIDYNKQINDSI